MMRFAVVLLSLSLSCGTSHAGPSKPDVTIGINSEGFDKGAIGALEPHVNWETSGTFEGCDVSVRFSDNNNNTHDLLLSSCNVSHNHLC